MCPTQTQLSRKCCDVAVANSIAVVAVSVADAVADTVADAVAVVVAVAVAIAVAAVLDLTLRRGQSKSPVS